MVDCIRNVAPTDHKYTVYVFNVLVKKKRLKGSKIDKKKKAKQPGQTFPRRRHQVTWYFFFILWNVLIVLSVTEKGQKYFTEDFIQVWEKCNVCFGWIKNLMKSKVNTDKHLFWCWCADETGQICWRRFLNLLQCWRWNLSKTQYYICLRTFWLTYYIWILIWEEESESWFSFSLILNPNLTLNPF